MAAHVGRGEAAERVATGCIRVTRHGADYSLQVLLLFQAAGVGLGLAWRGRQRWGRGPGPWGGARVMGRGQALGQGHSRSRAPTWRRRILGLEETDNTLAVQASRAQQHSLGAPAAPADHREAVLTVAAGDALQSVVLDALGHNQQPRVAARRRQRRVRAAAKPPWTCSQHPGAAPGLTCGRWRTCGSPGRSGRAQTWLGSGCCSACPAPGAGSPGSTPAPPGCSWSCGPRASGPRMGSACWAPAPPTLGQTR